MKKLVFSLAIVISSVILFTSCKGTAGPAGPAGPAGATGATGAIGPAGPTGTANVIYSAWGSPASWLLENFFGKTVRRGRITAPGITAAVYNQGVLKVFGKFGASDAFMVPYTAHNITQAVMQVIDPRWNVGFIDIRFYNIPDNNDPGALVGAEFRYVIIPGGVAGSRIISGPAAGYTIDQVKAMSYEQIKTLFNIPENGTNIK